MITEMCVTLSGNADTLCGSDFMIKETKTRILQRNSMQPTCNTTTTSSSSSKYKILFCWRAHWITLNYPAPFVPLPKHNRPVLAYSPGWWWLLLTVCKPFFPLTVIFTDLFFLKIITPLLVNRKKYCIEEVVKRRIMNLSLSLRRT